MQAVIFFTELAMVLYIGMHKIDLAIRKEPPPSLSSEQIGPMVIGLIFWAVLSGGIWFVSDRVIASDVLFDKCRTFKVESIGACDGRANCATSLSWWGARPESRILPYPYIGQEIELCPINDRSVAHGSVPPGSQR